MGTIHDTLTCDHRRCDELFVAAEEAAVRGDLKTATQRFDEFRRATEHHFRIEEETLFPAFEAATATREGPTAVMRTEHDMMRRLFEEMTQALAQGADKRYLSQSETLLVLMQQHNLKEEQILYRLADSVLASIHAELHERIAACLQQEG